MFFEEDQLKPKASLDLDNPDDVDWLHKWSQKAQKELKGLRTLLWLRHGCLPSALYGDDGELQCSNCMIDFNRMSAEQIEHRWIEINAPLMVKILEEFHKTGKIPTAKESKEKNENNTR